MRNKRGRPKEYKPRVQMHFFLSPELDSTFTDIAFRDSKTKNELIVELIQDYSLRHGSGNDSYKLTEFDAGLVRAYPTAWKHWTREEVAALSREEKLEIRKMLETNLSLVNDDLLQIPNEALRKIQEVDIIYCMTKHKISREEAITRLSKDR